MLALVIPYSENTISWRTYDTVVLALARLYKLMSISLPIFVLPLFGLLSCVKPHLKLLALVIPYLWNRNVRYDIVFTLGPFYINKSQFCYPCLLSLLHPAVDIGHRSSGFPTHCTISVHHLPSGFVAFPSVVVLLAVSRVLCSGEPLVPFF